MQDREKVLIVEDDGDVLNQMSWALSSQFDVIGAEDRTSAIAALREARPALATLDLGLPPSPGDAAEGFLALGQMLEADPLLKVVIITGQGERENALTAISRGAFDFFSKPVDLEALKVVLGRAAFVYRVELESRQRQESRAPEAFEGMIGTSPQLQVVFNAIRKVAVTEIPVLISGESGTGKELAARAIHKLSSRVGAPFVAINCGAIPDNLLESELFGHEKGAFTGAHIQRPGRIESAQGGTLFLDEIGELSPPLQVKILRFLQDRVVERVGGRRLITVDTRVIAATNADLHKGMAEGKFREDLYYRIRVIEIAMPALRDREGDISLLAQTLLERLAAEQGKKLLFSRKAVEALQAHPWPGNVRELENRIRRAVIMAEGSQITPQDLQLGGAYAAYDAVGLSAAREAVERDMIERAITRNRGNLTRCAEELKISRSSLYELIEKLGISRK